MSEAEKIAYENGKSAHDRGLRWVDNPYYAGPTKLTSAWAKGFKAAANQSKKVTT